MVPARTTRPPAPGSCGAGVNGSSRATPGSNRPSCGGFPSRPAVPAWPHTEDGRHGGCPTRAGNRRCWHGWRVGLRPDRTPGGHKEEGGAMAGAACRTMPPTRARRRSWPCLDRRFVIDVGVCPWRDATRAALSRRRQAPAGTTAPPPKSSPNAPVGEPGRESTPSKTWVTTLARSWLTHGQPLFFLSMGQGNPIIDRQEATAGAGAGDRT